MPGTLTAAFRVPTEGELGCVGRRAVHADGRGRASTAARSPRSAGELSGNSLVPDTTPAGPGRGLRPARHVITLHPRRLRRSRPATAGWAVLDAVLLTDSRLAPATGSCSAPARSPQRAVRRPAGMGRAARRARGQRLSVTQRRAARRGTSTVTSPAAHGARRGAPRPGQEPSAATDRAAEHRARRSSPAKGRVIVSDARRAQPRGQPDVDARGRRRPAVRRRRARRAARPRRAGARSP